MQDSALGALIPFIESFYGIGYAIVSLLFLTSAVGFLLAAFTSDAIFQSVGRARTLMLATAVTSVGYIIWLVAPERTPYGFLVVAPFFTGAGASWNLAQINVFVSSLDKPTLYNGWLHGSYGIGGIAGPLVATSLASQGIPWQYFYFLPLGITVFNCFFSGYIFLPTEREKQTLLEQERRQQLWRQRAQSEQETSSQSSDQPLTRTQVLIETLRNKPTILTSLFILSYQGAEVSLGGWIVSFLISARGGDPSNVGYVASGFWGGVTLGRFLLSGLCGKFGERRAVVVLLAGCAGMEILVWLVPNVIGSAVSVALVGFLLGPVVPCTMGIITRMLSRKLHVSSLSFIMAFGSSGGALWPFSVGLISQFKGPFVVHPVAIGSFVLMEVLWLLLPKVPKRVI
ncbi:MFS general substrate transporter [Gloeophyllum trabeum ATCC 11539]|uniref:MFS general substrate transporter n=1 Tax=Gloeophyllum trabeum (strain ATCC 11539 / FP-39264 / Madison 617) TaxID=670483 RepID=S7PYV7_GLOTA|nr:MFS general substrate transporter [Gloeophyllum trabeum ATCC 11539]EPQ52831.1 MFS general substrate transporter [Gloeophyllum trabeum ATCC 11539]